MRLLRFGLPTGLQQFLDIACWTTFIQLVGRLGTEQLSATSLVFNLNALVFIPLLGLGTAVTVLTGHRIGEGRPQLAVRTAWLAFAMAAIYVALFCGIYLFAPEVIVRPMAWPTTSRSGRWWCNCCGSWPSMPGSTRW